MIHLLEFSCIMCLSSLYFLNYSFHYYLSLVIACITWYLNDDILLHIYILLPFKWGQTIVYLYIIAIFKWSSRVQEKSGEKRRFSEKSAKSVKVRDHFLWSAENHIFHTESDNFLSFLNFSNLVLVWNLDACTWILIL